MRVFILVVGCIWWPPITTTKYLFAAIFRDGFFIFKNITTAYYISTSMCDLTVESNFY